MPREIWSKFDVDEAMILSARPNEKLKKALRHWCHCSHQHLADGLLLVRTVPPWLARDLQLFVRGGLRILEEIRRSDYDVWSREIEVSRNTKLSLLFRASLFPRSIRVPTLE
jgi:phytoene/squalene synthetase